MQDVLNRRITSLSPARSKIASPLTVAIAGLGGRAKAQAVIGVTRA
jgi:hypothetical protein